MELLKYNGYTFKTGDNVLIRLKKSNFFKGKLYVMLSDKEFYLLHNNTSFVGNVAPDKLGYKYSWVMKLERGIITQPEERDLILIPISDKININEKIILNTRLHEFLATCFKNLTHLFYLNLGSLENCVSILDSTEGFVELQDSYGKKVKIKLGRLIRSLIVEYNEHLDQKMILNDALIEDVHNKWISFTTDLRFEIKKGQDILDYAYNTKHHHKEGTLKSCMNNRPGDLHLYRDNPDKINVMIFYKHNQIVGRTLLWKCTDDKWYHDRLYSSFDNIRQAMIDILKNEGFQSAYQSPNKYVVNLENITYRSYPYLDTFKYISTKDKTVSNRG
jgi:hypothetical protein